MSLSTQNVRFKIHTIYYRELLELINFGDKLDFRGGGNSLESGQLGPLVKQIVTKNCK